ncbi:carbohydrate ABC transporter permease [Algisphaera agarilytica]|uniref:Multiple sugar transport system permease protein n=1 Tax=Algisphaera agarilytica TaxID=1385975 RepID=A0A7X0H4J7_9BACT|nr:sugar ABC transporter permease [Algisphaera agarilytica]MBB6429125.1 multiple sugar transport system permease protein [Algisphaera agarilytica]
MTRDTRRRLTSGLLFVSPWVIGALVFSLYPIGMAVYYSFTDYDVLRKPVWVGSMNYREMVVDGVFWRALWNTMVYSLFAVPMSLGLSLVVAVLLNRPILGRSVFRTCYYIPAIVPLVAVGMIWIWLFNGDLGLINHALTLVGIEGPQWTGDPAWTKPMLIMSSVWQIGGSMVLFLAGLQDVPRSLYESADIDGAGPFNQFWHITVPVVSPVLYFNLIMGIIAGVQEFVKPFVMMPDGGPDRSALFYAVYIYQNAFQYSNMGYACAMAVVLFLIILGLTWAANRLVSRHVYYAGE